MELFAGNSRVERYFRDEGYRTRQLGAATARKLELRFNQMEVARNLAALSTIPGLNPHPLSGRRTGQIAVTVHGGVRIVFTPHHDPPPLRDDGGLDLQRVTAVRIIEIGDYHRG